MKKLSLLLVVMLIGAMATVADAQTKPRRINIKQGDLKNVSTVKITIDGKEFPESLLYKADRQNLLLLPGLIEDEKGRPHFLTSEIAIKDIDEVIIYNRKQKIKSSIIGGVVGGVGSYLIVDQLSQNTLRSASIELLGQAPESKFVETYHCRIPWSRARYHCWRDACSNQADSQKQQPGNVPEAERIQLPLKRMFLIIFPMLSELGCHGSVDPPVLRPPHPE